jgi:hypothetical protein
VNSEVRSQFEALLLQPLLAPLESAFGEYGEIAGESFGENHANDLAQ